MLPFAFLIFPGPLRHFLHAHNHKSLRPCPGLHSRQSSYAHVSPSPSCPRGHTHSYTPGLFMTHPPSPYRHSSIPLILRGTLAYYTHFPLIFLPPPQISFHPHSYFPPRLPQKFPPPRPAPHVPGGSASAPLTLLTVPRRALRLGNQASASSCRI